MSRYFFQFHLGTLLCFLFVQQTTIAQQGSIRGKINNPTWPCMIRLYKKPDSVLIKSTGLSDSSYQFDQIPYGHYFLEAANARNMVVKSEEFDLKEPIKIIQDLVFPTDTNLLRQVKITSAKPVIEHQADKLIYHVENTPESPANDALTVLQKAPGVQVDQQGNLSMRGKKGVIVMINGKLTYLSGTQLNALLRSTTASQIARIEVISNPSARYDAEGNAGIVNIVLRKDQKLGTNGILSLSYGHGRFHKSVNSVNLNSRGRKVNVYGMLQYMDNKGFNDLTLYRKFYQQYIYQGAYRQSNQLIFPHRHQTGKIGMDYFLTTKTTLGIATNLQQTGFKPYSQNIAFIEDALGLDQSYYISGSNSRETYRQGSVNLNSQTQLDSNGSSLNSDWDYVGYENRAVQKFNTRFYTLQHQEYKPSQWLEGRVVAPIQILVGKVDWVQQLRNKLKLEAGWKSSLVKHDNRMYYYDYSNGIYRFDTLQSSHFVYREQINAFYASLSGKFNMLTWQAGLRTEQTRAQGNQLLNGQSFARNYWQLFPSAFIQYQAASRHELGANISRRIQRPGYDLLNPVKLFIDATTFKVGNPYLVPQESWIAEFSYTLDQKWTSTLNSTWINKSLTEVLIPDEQQSNVTLQTYRNISRQWVLALTESVQWQPLKNWTCQGEINLYYSFYKGILANQSIRSGVYSWNAKCIQILNLPKSITLQADAFFQFRERYSFTSIEPFGSMNLSVQKNIWEKRVQVKISAQDIFYTARFKGNSIFNQYFESYAVERDSRTLLLALTIKLGKQTVPGSRRRGTGADEEKQRAGKAV